MKIVFTQCTFSEHFDDTVECVKRIKTYVDRMVIIHDDLTEDQEKQLQNFGCEVYRHRWVDQFSTFRNYYVNQVENGDMIFAFDPDEPPSETLCQNLRKIVESADEGRVWSVGYVQVEDHYTDWDGTVRVTRTDWQKPMLFIKREGTKYVGNPHETIKMLDPVYRNLKDWTDCVYQHRKTAWRQARNGVRNDYVSESNREGPRWIGLRRMCGKLGIRNWYQMRNLLKQGNVPKELFDWIVVGKDDINSEWKDWFLWYRYLHKEEVERRMKDGA